MERYKVVNVARIHCIPHVPESIEFDRGIVLDTEQKEKHIITGELQDREVFTGLMPACLAWARGNQ